jgi:hypothetical protein
MYLLSLLCSLVPLNQMTPKTFLALYFVFSYLQFCPFCKKGGEKKEVIKNAYMNSALAATSLKAIRYIEMIDHEGVLYISSDVI